MRSSRTILISQDSKVLDAVMMILNIRQKTVFVVLDFKISTDTEWQNVRKATGSRLYDHRDVVSRG